MANHALRHTTTSEFAQTVPESCNYINNNFYVDDRLGFAVSSEATVDILAGARRLLSDFNTQLHKIVSNDKAVLDAIPASEISADIWKIGLCS